MQDYILVVDQSTTASKAYLVSRQGHIIDRASKEHTKYFPKEGWSEHDAVEILNNVKACLKELVFRNPYTIHHICAIAMTNQRETVVLWDKETGEPVCRAIVWQCTRTHAMCEALKADGYQPLVLEKTGLKIDPYFSATKVKWILDHVETARTLEQAGRLAMGTMDAWLVWNLDVNHNHFTDHTNASRTLLYNLHTHQWDEELCALFGIPMSVLPTIQFSDAIFGAADLDGLLARPVPITGIIGDSQAAFYAQECFEEGQTKMTLGTGSSLMMNAGKGTKAADPTLVRVLGYRMQKNTALGLEAIVNCNGECINWAKDELKLFTDYSELNAGLFEQERAVTFVPALTGLGIPAWNAKARGMFVNMDRSTTSKHLLAAILDGVLCQLCDAAALLDIPRQEVLRIDGGISRNPVLMNRLAGLLDRDIQVSVHEDLSAMGAWMSAVHGLGWELEWKDRPVITYHPNMDAPTRRRILNQYHQALDCAVYLAGMPA